MFFKMRVLKNFANSIGKQTPVLESLFNKGADLGEYQKMYINKDFYE